MKILQEVFDSQIREYLGFHKVGTKLIKRRFDNLGIHLTEDQLTEIERKLQNFEGDTITVDIDENQLLSFGLNLEDDFRIDLSDSDKEVEEIVNQFIQGL